MKNILSSILVASGASYLLVIQTMPAMVVFGLSMLVFLSYPLLMDYDVS